MISDLEDLLQKLAEIPVEVGMVSIAIWILIVFLIVRAVKKSMEKTFSQAAEGSGGQTQDRFLNAIEKLLPMMKNTAIPPDMAKTMRKRLSKKLNVPEEFISSLTVRGQLAAHGVSAESIAIVEQILRSGETDQYGYSQPAATEFGLRDILKASREVERVGKH